MRYWLGVLIAFQGVSVTGLAQRGLVPLLSSFTVQYTDGQDRYLPPQSGADFIARSREPSMFGNPSFSAYRVQPTSELDPSFWFPPAIVPTIRLQGLRVALSWSFYDTVGHNFTHKEIGILLQYTELHPGAVRYVLKDMSMGYPLYDAAIEFDEITSMVALGAYRSIRTWTAAKERLRIRFVGGLILGRSLPTSLSRMNTWTYIDTQQTVSGSLVYIHVSSQFDFRKQQMAPVWHLQGYTEGQLELDLGTRFRLSTGIMVSLYGQWSVSNRFDPKWQVVVPIGIRYNLVSLRPKHRR